MLEHDFEESLGYWAYLTSNALEKAMNEELAAHGITFQQWQVLAWLSMEGGQLAQSDLADRLKIESSTLAGILERMERSGWVARETDSDDRRRKIVRPTAAVEPVWKRMVGCAKKVRAKAFRGLSAETIRQTREVLATVLSNLSPEAIRREKPS